MHAQNMHFTKSAKNAHYHTVEVLEQTQSRHFFPLLKQMSTPCPLHCVVKANRYTQSTQRILI